MLNLLAFIIKPSTWQPLNTQAGVFTESLVAAKLSEMLRPSLDAARAKKTKCFLIFPICELLQASLSIQGANTAQVSLLNRYACILKEAELTHASCFFDARLGIEGKPIAKGLRKGYRKKHTGEDYPFHRFG